MGCAVEAFFICVGQIMIEAGKSFHLEGCESAILDGRRGAAGSGLSPERAGAEPTGQLEGADHDDDWIVEDPLTVREIDLALAPYLTRTDRRRFMKALFAADLILFRDDGNDLHP